jgi:hypothetical protein
MNNLAALLLEYYRSIVPPQGLPKGIEVLFPFTNPMTQQVMNQFFNKFYSDWKDRRLILGINPGRFGAGTTGINFTGPRQLSEFCGIDNPFRDQTELSAEFIYEMIEQYGGPERFYGDYFIGAVSPLGFTRNGVNLNYYDDASLLRVLNPYIVNNIRRLIEIGFNTTICFCIGEDKNFKFLMKLNGEYGFFKQIIPLPHPRFIMQYRRKSRQDFINRYLRVLQM